MSALCHDLGHTSRTNSFEINTQSKLAIRYSDDSPLERHHTALLFKLCMETQIENSKKKALKFGAKENIFSGMSRKEYRRFRKSVIRMILSTDMKYHFKMVEKFKNEASQTRQNKENSIRLTRLVNSNSMNGGELSEVREVQNKEMNICLFCELICFSSHNFLITG